MFIALKTLRFSLVAVAVLALSSVSAYANPVNGTVVGGAANIVTGANTVDIHQTTQRAIIEWDSFNIAPTERTEFHQPSSTSVALNRIKDVNPSSIMGELTANGNVILINPNGVFFGASSRVDVNGLVATSSDITNANFMAGNMEFNIAGSPTATITNEGLITAKDAGLVGFVAPNVVNHGIITANLGRVEMASGDTFTLDFYGDGLIQVGLSDDITDQLVENTGTINAAGGLIKMTAVAGASIVNSLINIEGELKAPTASMQGGKIVIAGDADKTSVRLLGEVSARGDDAGEDGGDVEISSRYIGNNGVINVSGENGGDVSLAAKYVGQQGEILADGTLGEGGLIDITFSTSYIDAEESLVSAEGINDGGEVNVIGAENTSTFISGEYSVDSTLAQAGIINITAPLLRLYGARVHADGATGGNVNIGGEFQGGGTLAHADTTTVNFSSVLSAAGHSGDGGEVIVWSSERTNFDGTAIATGSHDGGLIELSSKDALAIGGVAETDAASTGNGANGELLLDPKNITIETGGYSAGGGATYALTNPNAGDSGNHTYGEANSLIGLSTGNTVVMVDDDDFAANDAGAVYLFNGDTGALISTIRGSSANDQISSGGSIGAIELTNGNFIIRSNSWDNGGATDAGAMTWVNGTTGRLADSSLGGTVSAANSIVGSTANDNLTNVVALTNGNYVVFSSSWDNGGTIDAGMAMWGNGATGTVGAASAANALVGTTANDLVGGAGVTVLTNGNYVVQSSNWSNGGTAQAGAVTWGNGTTGTVGAVSTTNSLYGTAVGDQVGNIGVTALSNGNYVAISSFWDNGGTGDAGAVTWGNGTTGTTGAVSTTNSLYGSTASDQVGNLGVTALTNGNYVVRSSLWDNGGTGDAGAATWGNGTTGTTGAVSTTNSLYGTQAFDYVSLSGVIALANGNYVVGSHGWDNGGTLNVGAATWGNGTTGTTGAVSTTNSIYGSTADDFVGQSLVALSDGDYVVVSKEWDNGGVVNAGAVTWADGTSATSVVVSTTNSLYGTSANDGIGSGGVQALTGNGNYVVGSSGWDNGGAGDAGAVTWGNGTAGTVGAVSTTNSIYGSTAGDGLGGTGLISVLSNGNYVIGSPSWDYGGLANAGAVTWINGTNGQTVEGDVGAAITVTNSNISSLAGAQLGLGQDQEVLRFSDGDYVVGSFLWDTFKGLIQFGDGDSGSVGLVTAATARYIGSAPGAGLVSASIDNVNKTITGGWSNVDEVIVVPYVIGAPGLTYASNSSGDVSLDPSFITDTLDAGTDVTLQANNDITVEDDIIANNPGGNGGALRLHAGRSILVNADITTDNGALFLYANQPAAAGVVGAQRDAGAAEITMAAGTSIDAGTGKVELIVQEGVIGDGGDITARNITGNDITLWNERGGDVIIEAGATLTASGANPGGGQLAISVILEEDLGGPPAAAGGNFINNSGAGAFVTPAGDWVILSKNPGLDTLGGLVGDESILNCQLLAGGACGTYPGVVAGNTLLYWDAVAMDPPAPPAPSVTVPDTVKIRVVTVPVVNPAQQAKQMVVAQKSLNNNVFEEITSTRSPAAILEEPAAGSNNEEPVSEEDRDAINRSRGQGINVNEMGGQLISIDPELKRRLNVGI